MLNFTKNNIISEPNGASHATSQKRIYTKLIESIQ